MATKEEDTEEVMFENKFTRYRKGALVGTKSGFAFIVYPMPSVGYFDDPLVARRDQASALGAEGKGKMGKAYMSQKKGVKAGGRARGRGAKAQLLVLGWWDVPWNLCVLVVSKSPTAFTSAFPSLRRLSAERGLRGEHGEREEANTLLHPRRRRRRRRRRLPIAVPPPALAGLLRLAVPLPSSLSIAVSGWLTSTNAEQCLNLFGPNKLKEKKESKFLRFMWNPLSWVMEAAAIMAIALANGGVRKLPGWQDFVGIITLLVMNSTISFIEENNAGNAAATLMGCLAPRAKNRALLEQLAAIVNDDKGMNRLQQGG
ncbi:hypothetical protein OsJ_08950 [Oryza sativa Japonica Group]|uniref:Cation-transporting P-type ATPase N-terminal domain-containing protein n=2 Tax=Oryza TaxID=4527 RepID=B9F4L5_ORYSJ|nr:hypothetical protein OsJ_08950 [Oryza sativa Japonica Group]